MSVSWLNIDSKSLDNGPGIKSYLYQGREVFKMEKSHLPLQIAHTTNGFQQKEIKGRKIPYLIFLSKKFH